MDTCHLYIFHLFIGVYFIFHIITHHGQKALVLVLIVFIVFHVKKKIVLLSFTVFLTVLYIALGVLLVR